MKNLLLGLALISAVAYSQTTKTSVQDGDFLGAGTWDCGLCIPQSGDTVIINHNINMNTGISYSAGSITINASGSLSDGTASNDMLVNGGQLINHGTFQCDGFLLQSGYFENNGTTTLDSLLTQDTTSNTGTITVYDFLNDQDAVFDNEGEIIVTHNFNNQGYFENYLWGTMDVSNDASNCNIQSGMAELWNNGTICVGNDFSNCNGDTITGSGGKIFIAGASSNFGHVGGIQTINTPISAFTAGTGTTGTGVSFSNGTCLLGAEEEAIQPVFLYPNPATDVITITAQNINYKIYDISGRLVQSGASISGIVGVDQLNAGNYLIIIENQEINTVKQTFVKL